MLMASFAYVCSTPERIGCGSSTVTRRALKLTLLAMLQRAKQGSREAKLGRSQEPSHAKHNTRRLHLYGCISIYQALRAQPDFPDPL